MITMRSTKRARSAPVTLAFGVGVCLVSIAASATAQPIGTFRWRTEPYCNVVTLAISQNGGVFALDGFDEPCGGSPRLPLHGVAVPQPNGSITFGLSVLNVPGGAPVNLEASITLATAGGTWLDSAGNTGAFTFNPSGASGSSRPLQMATGWRSLLPRCSNEKAYERHACV